MTGYRIERVHAFWNFLFSKRKEAQELLLQSLDYRFFSALWNPLCKPEFMEQHHMPPGAVPFWPVGIIGDTGGGFVRTQI